MTRKDTLTNEILLKMQHHLDDNEIAILQSVLSESLYNFDINEKKQNLPSTIDNTNSYILNLFELRRGMKLSKNTMKEYMLTINEFLRIVDIPLIDANSDDIEYYLAYKKRSGCNNTTLNNKMRNLKSFFEFMKKNNFIKENPLDKTESFKEVKKPVDYLDVVTLDRLRDACEDYRDRAMLEWLRSTATRVGEISRVTINQINWGTGETLVYGEKTLTYRVVYVDDLARTYLKKYIIEQRGLSLDSELPLFTYNRGDVTRPLGDKGIEAQLRRIGKRSGLERRIYPHLFRKTTATNIVMRGGTVDEAGIYLGHASNGVTSKHYIGTQEDTIKYIHNKYVKAI